MQAPASGCTQFKHWTCRGQILERQTADGRLLNLEEIRPGEVRTSAQKKNVVASAFLGAVCVTDARWRTWKKCAVYVLSEPQENFASGQREDGKFLLHAWQAQSATIFANAGDGKQTQTNGR